MLVDESEFESGSKHALGRRNTIELKSGAKKVEVLTVALKKVTEDLEAGGGVKGDYISFSLLWLARVPYLCSMSILVVIEQYMCICIVVSVLISIVVGGLVIGVLHVT